MQEMVFVVFAFFLFLIGKGTNTAQPIYRNLLQNAINVSPTAEIILVDIAVQNGLTTLSVQNSGGAFTQEDFQKQVQAVRSSQTLNGLGLQLVQDLSDKKNAVIRFTTLANGTTAQITFTAKS